MKMSEIIEFAEEYNKRVAETAARKIVEDFRKFEEANNTPEQWGYLDDDKRVVRCRFSDLLVRYNGQDPLGPHGMDRRVGRDWIRKNYCVSTVFLGLDHGMTFIGERPIWFETAVLRRDNRSCTIMQRYSTFQEALIGHERVLAKGWARKGWARWLGYSQSHIRKVLRGQKAR